MIFSSRPRVCSWRWVISALNSPRISSRWSIVSHGTLSWWSNFWIASHASPNSANNISTVWLGWIDFLIDLPMFMPFLLIAFWLFWALLQMPGFLSPSGELTHHPYSPFAFLQLFSSDVLELVSPSSLFAFVILYFLLSEYIRALWTRQLFYRNS